MSSDFVFEEVKPPGFEKLSTEIKVSKLGMAKLVFVGNTGLKLRLLTDVEEHKTGTFDFTPEGKLRWGGEENRVKYGIMFESALYELWKWLHDKGEDHELADGFDEITALTQPELAEAMRGLFIRKDHAELFRDADGSDEKNPSMRRVWFKLSDIGKLPEDDRLIVTLKDALFRAKRYEVYVP